MKKIRLFASLVALMAVTSVVSAQEVNEEYMYDMAVKKTAILDKSFHFTPEQHGQVVSIIMKYDDPNTMRGTTPYSITELAERTIVEILNPTQQQYYDNNVLKIRESLRVNPPAPQNPGTDKNSGTKAPKKTNN